MNKYWKTRVRKEEKKAWDIANRSVNWQEDFYKQAYKRIETEIDALYSEILSGNRKPEDITRSELWRYKHYTELQNIVENESRQIGEKQLTLLDSTLDNVFRSVIGEDRESLGKGVNLLDNTALERIKRTVWSGESYSDRIWQNTNNLAIRVKDKLTDLVAIGKLPEEVKKELQKEFNVSYRVADRLIRTEASHVFNTAAMDRYEEAGVEQVEVLIEDDELICDDCKELDGKVFDIDKAPVLPIHPNCRCCYVPVVERKLPYKEPELEAEDERLNMVEDDDSNLTKEFSSDRLSIGSSSPPKPVFDDGIDIRTSRAAQEAIQSEIANFVDLSEDPTDRISYAKFYYGVDINLVPHKEGYYDIKAHGSSQSIEVFSVSMNAETVSNIIRQRKDYLGEPIRLLSCSTGKIEDGRCFAQDLANYLGVEVIAPQDLIFVDGKGRLFNHKSERMKDSDFRRFFPKEGN